MRRGCFALATGNHQLMILKFQTISCARDSLCYGVPVTVQKTKLSPRDLKRPRRVYNLPPQKIAEDVSAQVNDTRYAYKNCFCRSLLQKLAALVFLADSVLCLKSYDNSPGGELFVECEPGYGMYRVRSSFINTGSGGSGFSDRLWDWDCKKVQVLTYVAITIPTTSHVAIDNYRLVHAS